MKEIMLVPELPCKNCHKYEPNACVECFNKNGKKEQVPENFSELKELCKRTGHYAVNILKGGLLNKEYIFIFGLSFRDNGDIEDIENNNVAENRTPQQMWNIIKSLIGEEE